MNPTRRDDDLDSADMGGPISSLIPVLAREHRALAGSLLRGFGLYPGQELVLMLLWAKEPRLQSDLGKLLDIAAPTTSKAVQRLAAAGLLVREKSPEDARQVIVWLTQAGRDLQESI
ncbi:MAG: winged helix-turn-helix transcriptional regulator, partial [Kineosporiaceae bacterium]|nr:winged helix-turn-helix transcriptional regulator [Aeromicrobium sp.]